MAKEVSVEEMQYENNFQHTLDMVLTSNEKCLNQIKKSLSGVSDIKRAERLIEKSLAYTTLVSKDGFPIYPQTLKAIWNFPANLLVAIKRPPVTSQLEDKIALVKRFKANTSRINCKQYLTETHKNKLLLCYSTGSSFRANFSTRVKSYCK